MCIDVDTHSVQDDFNMLSSTSVKSQGGADFFTVDSFVQAVAVCPASTSLFDRIAVPVLLRLSFLSYSNIPEIKLYFVVKCLQFIIIGYMNTTSVQIT